MADSFTPNLNLRKPEVGAAFDTWGGAAGLNADLDLLDDVFLATGLGASVGLHVGTRTLAGASTPTDMKLLVDGGGQIDALIDGITFRDKTDPTKVLKLLADLITTATTRTLKAPDASGTIALTDDVAKRSPRGTVMYGLYGATAPEGTLFLNGTTFGSAASGATQRANADTWLLYDHFWTKLGATPTGGRGLTALADFNANKPMPLPNFAGRAPFALDNNGGITSANILTPGAGANATVRGGVVGQSTEAAGVSVSGTLNGGASVSGTLSGGYAGGELADAAGFSIARFMTSLSVINVSGTLNGSASVSGSLGGATAAVTNVPPGVACDCVIVM